MATTPFLNDLEVISVRVPSTIKQRLEKEYPRKGDTSKLVRALLKLFLNGEISKEQITKSTDLLSL